MASTWHQALSWHFPSHCLTQPAKGQSMYPCTRSNSSSQRRSHSPTSMAETAKHCLQGAAIVDTHEVRGIGLFQDAIHIVEFWWPSLGWHGLSFTVLIDAVSSG